MLNLTHHYINQSDIVGDSVTPLPIAGVLYINKTLHQDERGFFAQLFQSSSDLETIEPFHIQQINHAFSHQNVIRGFHAEDWNKYVTLIRGTAYKVLVDIRPQSPTFLHVLHVTLGEGTEALSGSIFIPRGIANSVCVINGPLDYLYFVDKLYNKRDPNGDQALSLYDPDLAIEWPVSPEKAVISSRDRAGALLKDLLK